MLKIAQKETNELCDMGVDMTLQINTTTATTDILENSTIPVEKYQALYDMYEGTVKHNKIMEAINTISGLMGTYNREDAANLIESLVIDIDQQTYIDILGVLFEALKELDNQEFAKFLTTVINISNPSEEIAETESEVDYIDIEETSQEESSDVNLDEVETIEDVNVSDTEEVTE